MPLSSVLIVGASRGLGQALVSHYSTLIGPENVFATVRAPSDHLPKGVNVIEGIDCLDPEVGAKIVDGLKGRTVQGVIIVAGLLKAEVRLDFAETLDFSIESITLDFARGHQG